MGASGPRSGGPSRRRAFTPAQKLAYVGEYEAALAKGEGGAYLRRKGLFSSQIGEWRRLRDSGMLEGKQPGDKVGRPSAQQDEIARLRRELEITSTRLARTEAALDIMGKARALLEDISGSAKQADQRGRR